MSVLADIRAAIKALVEGTAVGGIRMPTAGAFAIVGDDYEVQQADASDSTPRPVYLGAGTSVLDPTLPSDVSGDYHWEARQIPIVVLYAYDPDDTPISGNATIDDDEMSLKRVLCEPLNIALTAGWGKCLIETDRLKIPDEENVGAVKALILTATIAYREDWS